MGTTSEELKKLYKKLGGKDPKVAGFSAPGEILNAINEIPLPTEYELPTVTTEDAGDVLVVNEEGKWDKGEAGGGLPEVTTDDNGDILQVVEGAWAKAAMSGGDCVVYTAHFSSGQAILDNGTISEIAGITSSKAVFIICRSGSVQGQNGLYYYSGRGRVGASITENTLHFSKVFRYYNGTSNEIVFSELTAYVPDGGSKFNYESSTLATT